MNVIDELSLMFMRYEDIPKISVLHFQTPLNLRKYSAFTKRLLKKTIR